MMVEALNQFKHNFEKIYELDAIYDHLVNHLKLPNDLQDILRAEVVYAVSALDKLIHELVRIGMIETFEGQRPMTEAYKNFQIPLSLQLEMSMNNPLVSPPSYLLEQAIITSHSHLSFQDPNKIAKALSLIWDEGHKWQNIATAMGENNQRNVTIELKNIVARRNKIVHESDFDIVINQKSELFQEDSSRMISFIERLGIAIYNCAV